MRVLLLTQVVPYPLDSGAKIKTWNVLRCLATRHEVTLVSFARGESRAMLDHVARYCRAVHTVPMRRTWTADLYHLARSVARGESFLMLRDERAAMRRLVDQVARETPFDVVHADQLNMAPYALRVPGARRVLDLHNALWVVYKQLAETVRVPTLRALWQREWPRLRAYEAHMCRTFDTVLAVSETDKADLEDAAGTSLAATVIPIAIDTAHNAPITRRPDADHLLHLGTMQWPPNVDAVDWFAHAIWPHIRAGAPRAQCDVVGARPPRRIRNLGARVPGINVTGYVDDPTPYLQGAAVMVAPLRAGSGMRVKILEAMARQIPIVSTTVGCGGIAVEHGQHLLMADDAHELAAACLRILNDPSLAARLGRTGRALVETHYSIGTVGDRLLGVYERLT